MSTGEAEPLLYALRQERSGSYMTRICSAWPFARLWPEDEVLKVLECRFDASKVVEPQQHLARDSSVPWEPT
jgi:hypothetical protein